MSACLTRNMYSAYVCLLGAMVIVLGKATVSVSFTAAMVIYFISGVIIMLAFACADARGKMIYTALTTYCVGVINTVQPLCLVSGMLCAIAIMQSERKFRVVYTIAIVGACIILTILLR